jgi:hypothetical protein
MGTNYYAQGYGPCPICGHTPAPLHIGKSSAGWCFSLHVIPELGLHDWPDWEDYLAQPRVTITDEYQDTMSLEDLRLVVMARQWPADRTQSATWYAENAAEPGPAGLARARVDGRHCVGHGAGTWDLICGEFS